jgi:hypothetical protein
MYVCLDDVFVFMHTEKSRYFLQLFLYFFNNSNINCSISPYFTQKPWSTTLLFLVGLSLGAFPYGIY